MKNLSLISIVSLTMAAGGPVWGQTPEASAPPPPPPLPPGPLIQKYAPAFSEWTVTVKYSAPPAPSPSPGARPASGEAKEEPNTQNKVMMITKTGDIRREVTALANGNRTTIFYSKEVQIIQEPGSKIPIIQLADHSGSHTDFHGFKWIGQKNFTGISKVQGKDCMIFRGKAPRAEQEVWLGGESSADSSEVPAVAVIDVDTRLPFSVQIGDETRIFRFNNPPTTPLAFPPEVQAVIDERQKKMQADIVAPPHP